MNKDKLDAAIAIISEGIEVLEAIGEQHTQLPAGQLTRLQTDRIALSALREARDRMEGCKHCKDAIEDEDMTIPMAPLRSADGRWTVRRLEVPYKYCANCGRKLGGS